MMWIRCEQCANWYYKTLEKEFFHACRRIITSIKHVLLQILSGEFMKRTLSTVLLVASLTLLSACNLIQQDNPPAQASASTPLADLPINISAHSSIEQQPTAVAQSVID